jgi:uncharacterized repeat protein (TIGR01451 family)
MKFSILSTALCLLFATTLSAQIFDRVYPNQLRLWKTVELADGNLISIGSLAPNMSVLLKTNRSGGLIASKSLGLGFPDDLQLSNAIYAVVGENVMRVNPDLTVAWSVSASGEYFKRVRTLPNGNLLTLSDNATNRISLHILNSQTGATVSRKVIIEPAIVSRQPEFTILKNSLYAIVNDSIWKYNFNGDLLAKLPFGMENLFDISTATDQTLLVSRGESILFKVDTVGFQMWRRDIWHKSWSNANSNGILLVNELNPGRSSGEVSLLDNMGNLKWIRPIGEKRDELSFQPNNCLQTSDGNVLVFGSTYVPTDSFRNVRSRIVKLGNDNQMYLNRIVGTAHIDYNFNCKKDGDDIINTYALVTATNSVGDTYWGMMDAKGNYSIRCDTGIYNIKLNLQNMPRHLKWTACLAQSKKFIDFGKTDTVNLFQTITDTFGTVVCTVLDVNIGMGLVRLCANNQLTVNYANVGNTKAQNTVICVQIDTFLTVQGTSIPVSRKVGNKYYFNLGELSVNTRGRLTISTLSKCVTNFADAERFRGKIICLKAQIFADTTCSNLNAWSGADLTVEGTCLQDSVLFKVKNVGTARSQIRKLIVIENDSIKRLPSIQLESQAQITRSFPANGSTWRLTVEQEPYHPNSTAPTAFVEGCVNTAQAVASTGFATHFANDDAALSVAVSCDTLRMSYDPNDKTGYPYGYGNKHYIDQNQDVDYTIRFQNVGNDTAFKVVIRDTIDTRFMDFGSIEFGASSHNYEPTVYDKNIIQFTFNNILLVDSFTNEPASNGYVKFRIKQKKDVLIGSKINNSAAIYFDYNAPVITNVAQHTVGKPILLTTKIEETLGKPIAVDVSPNPFETRTTFKIGAGGPLSINGIFELFDVSGRLLRQADFSKNEYVLERQDLSVGIYIYKIKTTDGGFSSGKVSIQ